MSVEAWADRFRLSCQSCATHLAGPVVAWSTMLEQLDADERRAVGRRIESDARVRLDATTDPTVRAREARVIAFVTALFGLAAADA